METEKISFEDLGLDERTLKAVARKGFENPSPIQVLAIPRLLNGDANLIAKARTGTGKTAAFGLPIIQNLQNKSDHVRALILEPTRELAVQTSEEMDSFSEKGFPKTIVVYGGASMSTQIRDLKRNPDIVVGTPGRIQDHLKRGSLKIDNIDYFILDEGDEMLDMGFIDDIEAIFDKANPDSRILIFSATMPSPILKIAQRFMGEYEIVEEKNFAEEPLLIKQSYWVVRQSDKTEALVRLIDSSEDFYGLVFTQTKADADMVSKTLDERGYEAAALHGDIPQGQREKILGRFKSKKTRVLVATDVAARGIDISGLSHVVNYSLPFDPATYIHRIGRTGRAGAEGMAITFVRPEERRKLSYLISAVKRSSKGDITEEQIPSVRKVLEKKRVRMLEKLQSAITVEISTDSGQTETEDETVDVLTIPENKSTILQPEQIYTEMAVNLCENKDPQEVLAAVLSVTYGKSLDKSHYNEISTPKRGAGVGRQQIRLYVQMGKNDGYRPRDIADYFSKLLNIPGRLVDNIDIASNFCLLSLPSEEARKVLDYSKRDHSIPHIHIDTKSNFSSSNRSREYKSGDRFYGNGGRRRDSRNHFDGSREKRNYHGRPNVHTSTRRNGKASLYKRSSAGPEQY